MAALPRHSLPVEELNTRLVQAGNELLQEPPSSIDELLQKLDNLEHLLSMVEQVPIASVRDALRPAMDALITDGLLQHPEMDVKISVASCIGEVVRITAPEQPYDDKRIKVFFELAVLAFGKLSSMDDRSYSKAVSILKVLSKYRVCVLMLDLQLDTLVVQMFQHFLHSIRPEHPDDVFTLIEEVMSMIIEESEEISVEILNILISSVKNENQKVSPRSYTLGERVFRKSAVELQPYLPTAVTSLNISINEYSRVFGSMWSGSKMNAMRLPQRAMQEEVDHSHVENGPEEPSDKVTCTTDSGPFKEETSMCIPDSDYKVSVAHETVILCGPPMDNSLKSPAKNVDSIGLALHAVSEKVTPFSDQPSDLPGKDDPDHKEDHVVPETDACSKESQHGDAMNQQKNTDSEHIKELGSEATQASKKRGWKPNMLKNPEEGYDHVWLSGERRSKAHIRCNDYGKYDKKRGSCSRKRAISDGFHLSSCVEKTAKRRQSIKNDKIGQNDDAKLSLMSAGATGALTHKKEPALVASELFVGLGASEKKYEKDDEKNVPARCHEEKRQSSVEESEIQAMNSVTITMQSSLPKISKEQHKMKNSQEALGSESITKESNFPKPSAEQRKGKTSPSQEETFDSVSITRENNFSKTSNGKRKRKNSSSQEEGSIKKASSEHAEELIGCRVRVWWPMDQMFYEGCITGFDSSMKKHIVDYDDGEREMLELSNEHWEMIGDDNASDNRQEQAPVPGQSDPSYVHLGPIIDSSCQRESPKKKKQSFQQVLNVDNDVSVLTPGTESKKIIRSKEKLYKGQFLQEALNVGDVPVLTLGTESKKIRSKTKLYKGQASGDLTPPSSRTMPLPKIKVECSESWMPPRKGSCPIEDGDTCSELVDVHGYKVKVSSAPTLAAIFAKYGDITVNCHYKSPTIRASLLEAVSDVVRQLRSSDTATIVSAMKTMKTIVSDAAEARLDVTWLQQYLDEFHEEQDTNKSSRNLMALRASTMLVTEAAKKDSMERDKEVLAAKKQLKEAQSRAREAERSVKVFEILGEKIRLDIKESKDQENYRRRKSKKLL